jgi:hypothetical protein
LGEAYSGAYLTSREHILAVDTSRNMRKVSCEMASSVLLSTARRSKKIALAKFRSNAMMPGLAIQSLDVLDYAVLHLSAYERSQIRYASRVGIETNIDAVEVATSFLESKAVAAGRDRGEGKFCTGEKNSSKLQDLIYNTVVVMPFLGVRMGAGHSKLANRYVYLKACFWSLYATFPFITVGVSNKDDKEWLLQSGLPFYDILLLSDIPKPAALPLSTLNAAKEKMEKGAKICTPLTGRCCRDFQSTSNHVGVAKIWDFDYIFYTESDQIVLSRIWPDLYHHLRLYPRRMLLPHRLMPYRDSVLRHQSRFARSWYSYDDVSVWRRFSCCLPRQNCIERKSWISLTMSERSLSDKELRHNMTAQDQFVPILDYHGMHVPLGNSHFRRELFRHCALREASPNGPGNVCS